MAGSEVTERLLKHAEDCTDSNDLRAAMLYLIAAVTTLMENGRAHER